MSRGAGALVVALTAVAWFSLTAPVGLELRDEGRLLLRSQHVAEKALPNRDFSDVYGPGVSGLNGLLLDVFDRRIVAIRWSLVAVKAVAVVAVWMAASRVASGPIAACATAFAILTFGRASWNLNTPYAALYVLALGAVALALLLRAHARAQAWPAAAAGLVLGAALLFKHSLAAMYAVSLGLGIVAAMLLEPRRERGRGEGAALALLFVAMLSLPFVVHQWPFGFVRPQAYLLFFAPAHALGVLVLLAARHPDGARGGLGMGALVAAGVGLLLVPAAVAGFYASRGALGYALSDLGAWPRMLSSYAAPVGLPKLPATATLVFAVAVAGAALCALRGRRLAAGAWAITAGLALVPATGEPGILANADRWSHGLHALLAWCLLVVCAPALRAPERPPWLVPAVIVASFHHATGFQIFPRAGYNTLLSLPLVAPSLAVVGAAVWRALDLQAMSRPRRAVAYAALAVPVIALASPAALSVVELRRAPMVPIPFPEAEGLSMRADRAGDVLAMREVVSYLQTRPDAPVLLFSNDAMILFLGRRRSMRPELDLYFQLMADQMLRRGAMPVQGSSRLIAELRKADDALVVVSDDAAAGRLRRYLPRLAAYLDWNFAPAFSAGPYTVLRHAVPPRRITPRRPGPPA